MANICLIRIAAVAALVAVSSDRALVQGPAQAPAVVPVVISGKVHCSGDQNPIVIQRYWSIEVIAKRPVKCG